MSKSNNDYIVEITEEGLKDLNSYIEDLQIPGLSTVFKIGAFLVHLWEVREFDSFLDKIRMRLKFNHEQLADYLKTHGNEKWLAKGIARGWKTLQETMDPLARACAELMVLEYLEAKQTPDRHHRQLGELFKEVDAEILKITLKIADFCQGLDDYGWALVGRGEYRGERGYYIGAEYNNDGWVIHDKLATAEQETLILETLSILNRAQMLLQPKSSWSSHETLQLANQFEIYTHQIPLWKRLRNYLEPVRQA